VKPATPREWTRLGLIHNAIGYSDEGIELWLATGLEKREAEARCRGVPRGFAAAVQGSARHGRGRPHK
jgi:hypothetical protein